MSTTARAAVTPGSVLSRIGLAGWIVRAAAGLRGIGPYAAIEILLPGGSLFALLLWLYRRHKMAGRSGASSGRALTVCAHGSRT